MDLRVAIHFQSALGGIVRECKRPASCQCIHHQIWRQHHSLYACIGHFRIRVFLRQLLNDGSLAVGERYLKIVDDGISVNVHNQGCRRKFALVSTMLAKRFRACQESPIIVVYIKSKFSLLDVYHFESIKRYSNTSHSQPNSRSHGLL